jgi:glycosyltransferase involved in cell wall biosynthesis
VRILHLLNELDELGTGMTNVAIDLACRQAETGHTVFVVSRGGTYEPLLANYDIPHFKVDQKRRPLTLLRALVAFRRILKTCRPDIVHVHMMTGAALAFAARLGSSYRIVSTVHNEFQRGSILMGLADRVIVVSDSGADTMMRFGVPKRKIVKVRNGTVGSARTLWALRDLAEPPTILQRPAITTVAGMQFRKGISDLIAAFESVAEEFPNANLYLVGDGPDRALFEEQARLTRVSGRIHFEGFQKRPSEYLASTDVFVLASHAESMPLVLSEAREAGCAIIATDVNGNNEALNGGSAGLLVPPHDSHALAGAIAGLLRNENERIKWAKVARENLDWARVSRVVDETVAAYESAIERRSAVDLLEPIRRSAK